MPAVDGLLGLAWRLPDHTMIHPSSAHTPDMRDRTAVDVWANHSHRRTNEMGLSTSPISRERGLNGMTSSPLAFTVCASQHLQRRSVGEEI